MKITREYHEKLINLLEKEYNLYCDLKEVLILEKRALSEFDFEKLSELNIRKEGVLLNIVEIKNNRNKLIDEIIDNFKIENDVNLSFLEKISEAELKQVYADFKEKFKNIGIRIKNLNEINKFVIETSLKFIEKSLNMLNQNVAPSTYSNYGKVMSKAYSPSSPSFYTGKI